MAQASLSTPAVQESQPLFSTRQLIGLIAGPLAFFAMLLAPTPAGMSPEAMSVAATTLWIAIWWITEAIPIPATSLLPLVLLPLTGAMAIGPAAAGFANPLIFVFIGGFMIALAIERWNLHRRIALRIISAVGCTPTRIVLGFMAATAFLSMWISNTATAMMMTPMGMAVVAQMLHLMGNDDKARDHQGRFGTALMLGIAYAASIGGVATLVGTPPNIVLAGAAQELLGIEISFARWMLIGTPFALVFLIGTWWYLTQISFRTGNKEIPGGLDVVRSEMQKLGPMSPAERNVLIVFGLVAAAWITSPFLLKPIFPNIHDATIAIIGALVLFAIPAQTQDGERTFLLNWESTTKLPWGIVLLFGGGLAIADAFKTTGLAAWLGESLGVLNGLPGILVLLAVVALVIFLTEVTSNTATATLMMPVMVALGAGVGMNPLWLMIAAALAASCAFMLPVATPPNAIVFGSGTVTVPQMAKAGFWLNIAGVLLATAAVFVLVPLIWGM